MPNQNYNDLAGRSDAPKGPHTNAGGKPSGKGGKLPPMPTQSWPGLPGGTQPERSLGTKKSKTRTVERGL